MIETNLGRGDGPDEYLCAVQITIDTDSCTSIPRQRHLSILSFLGGKVAR